MSFRLEAPVPHLPATHACHRPPVTVSLCHSLPTSAPARLGLLHPCLSPARIRRAQCSIPVRAQCSPPVRAPCSPVARASRPHVAHASRSPVARASRPHVAHASRPPAVRAPPAMSPPCAGQQGRPDEHGAVRCRDGVQLGAHKPHRSRCARAKEPLLCFALLCSLISALLCSLVSALLCIPMTSWVSAHPLVTCNAKPEHNLEPTLPCARPAHTLARLPFCCCRH